MHSIFGELTFETKLWYAIFHLRGYHKANKNAFNYLKMRPIALATVLKLLAQCLSQLLIDRPDESTCSQLVDQIGNGTLKPLSRNAELNQSELRTVCQISLLLTCLCNKFSALIESLSTISFSKTDIVSRNALLSALFDVVT